MIVYFGNENLPGCTRLYPVVPKSLRRCSFGKLKLLFLQSWLIITYTDLCASQDMFETSLAAATGIDPSAIEIVPCQPQMW